MIQYSFVVPIYNDGYLAEPFCKEFENVFKNHLGKDDIINDVELIFINDGSPNNSYELLIELIKQYPFVKVINLSRNFGQHIATICGFRHASGQLVGMVDVDMQDPLDEIPNLLAKMASENADVVVCIRPNRAGPFLNKMTSRLFHFFLNKLTGYETPVNIGNLRIMNRRFLDVFNSLTEHSPFIGGLESWMGFKRVFQPIEHRERVDGRSSYNMTKRLIMAVDAVISFSDLPLKMAMGLGFLFSLVSFIRVGVLVVEKLFFVNILPGYTSTIALILLTMGTQLTAIGLVGLYIGKVLREVQNRPVYIVADKCNFE